MVVDASWLVCCFGLPVPAQINVRHSVCPCALHLNVSAAAPTTKIWPRLPSFINLFLSHVHMPLHAGVSAVILETTAWWLVLLPTTAMIAMVVAFSMMTSPGGPTTQHAGEKICS
jgi:hypothetical protein